MAERWKPIPGHNGKYEVSDHGRVRNTRTGRVRAQRLTTGGYDQVKFKEAGREHTYLAHRLVAQAFIPNPFNKDCVNHLDHDKTNNHISNLEWATPAENGEWTRFIYGDRGGPNHTDVKTGFDAWAPCMGEPTAVKAECCLLGDVTHYPSIGEAARALGMSHKAIRRVLNGERNTANGYRFRRV